ncbi:hypothetical protein, partial [Campylobacter concisus]|uniref:hypothetical protein n=1 Tax=Campylobacter concisus TaxID=199 RepID=UPI00112F92F4
YLSAFYTKPKIKKDCKDCHETQAYIASKADTHKNNTCASCHMLSDQLGEEELLKVPFCS